MEGNSENPQRDSASALKRGKFLYRINEVATKELSIKSYITAPLSVWVSAGLLALSCVLYITAFVTSGWGVITEVVTGRVTEVGLWYSCNQDAGSCQKNENLTGMILHICKP